MRWIGKTRTVRVVTPQGDRIYHSIEDVPEALRQVLKSTLEGPNSETILIANQEAYDRLSRQLTTLPTRIEELPSPAGSQSEPKTREQILKWAVGSAFGLGLALWSLWFWVTRNGT